MNKKRIRKLLVLTIAIGIWMIAWPMYFFGGKNEERTEED